MLEKTNLFRVILDNPWNTPGEILQSNDIVDLSKYHKLYAPIYKMIDGTFICERDTVYRLVDKNYETTIKAVQFTLSHVDSDIELFSSREKAEEALKERETKRDKRYTDSKLYGEIENIVLFSRVNFDTASILDIKRTLEDIKICASNAFKILKNDRNFD